MGAKTWMLAYTDGNAADILKAGPELDRVATTELVTRLFPRCDLESRDDGDLSHTCPGKDEIFAGCFSGLSIVAASELGIDYPSRLPARFLDAGRGRTVYLHAMHSVVDWFAYAKWHDGELVRSLSLAPDSGVLEDIGSRLPFEAPYWAGRHPAVDPEDDDDYPFPFHPLELGEAALLALFGYQLEGDGAAPVTPEAIPLAGFRRIKPWWKFW